MNDYRITAISPVQDDGTEREVIVEPIVNLKAPMKLRLLKQTCKIIAAYKVDADALFQVEMDSDKSLADLAVGDIINLSIITNQD